MKTRTPIVQAPQTDETPDDANAVPFFQTVEYAYAIARELAGIFAGKRLEPPMQESQPRRPSWLNSGMPKQKEAEKTAEQAI